MTAVDEAVAVEADATRWDVREPGLVDGMPEDIYHGDPVPGGSLSSTGARRLLPPGTPAQYRYELDHGTPPKKVWDVGKAAHAKVLGVGAGTLVPLDEHGTPYERWDTKRCKAIVAEAREQGLIPLKADEAATVDAMAEALLDHPIARNLLEGAAGRPEVSGFWRDPQLPVVWRRVRFDFLPDVDPTGRMVLPDYKTADKVDDEALARAIAEHGYHAQGAWYGDAVLDLGLAAEVAFVLVAQSKKPPYLVNTRWPDHEAIALGRRRNRRAIEVFAACQTSGHWPGYEDLAPIPVPAWAYIRDQEETTEHVG